MKENKKRSRDCMKYFSRELKKHAIEIINHKKMKMIPLT